MLDNVALGIAERLGVAGRLWRPASAYREVRDESMALLESLGIAADAGQRVLDLPYGKQRLVEIAIALGLKPKVLLLDEPAAGVPSHESERILEVLDRLPADIAILIIEHDMDLVFRFAKRITVLVQGQVLVEGTPARDRRRPAGARGVPRGRAGAWLRRSGSTACAPGTARPSCSRTSGSRSPSAARSRCSGGTGWGRRRCSRRSWGTRLSIPGRWRSAGRRSRGCRRSSGTVRASGTCRRRARSSRR